jgi:EAL domain-containing protein (putative c-di-GMP-specific phosphodiesterase class I)
MLKLDKELVAGALDDERAFSVASAIVDLAHAIGLTVVAEGVETTAHLDLARGMGCDFAQGYLIGRPGPLAVLGAPAEHLLAGHGTGQARQPR